MLSKELTIDEKLNIIGNEYDIPIEESFRKDVSVMCNLSQSIEEKGIAIGLELLLVEKIRNNIIETQILLENFQIYRILEVFFFRFLFRKVIPEDRIISALIGLAGACNSNPKKADTDSLVIKALAFLLHCPEYDAMWDIHRIMICVGFMKLTMRSAK